MTSNGANGQASYIYLGLAGETGRGRVVDTGLYRMADGGGEWESLQRGLPEMPAVRALAVHPRQPEIVYAGTQTGPYRSADRGEHWEKVNVPDHGLPVWSVLFHPHDPDVILVGYENCEIYRSDDAGERWTRLPVDVRFPEITTAPGANPAKRLLMLDASASQPDHLYGAIEVGGTIRSTDGGQHWENLSHGQYVNDDMVDMHGVLASRWRPGIVFGIARAGMFRSDDGGDHWQHVP
ncbi:MAG: WD40/YVTN/BNR-like repeat-containing protein, partial [Stellaceae bacterium]